MCSAVAPSLARKSMWAPPRHSSRITSIVPSNCAAKVNGVSAGRTQGYRGACCSAGVRDSPPPLCSPHAYPQCQNHDSWGPALCPGVAPLSPPLHVAHTLGTSSTPSGERFASDSHWGAGKGRNRILQVEKRNTAELDLVSKPPRTS